MKKKILRNQKNKVKQDIAKTVLTDGLGSIPYDQLCIESKIIDKRSYSITLQLLETLWKKSLKIDKKPCLTIGFKRTNNEVFLLQCYLTIQNKKER